MEEPDLIYGPEQKAQMSECKSVLAVQSVLARPCQREHGHH